MTNIGLLEGLLLAFAAIGDRKKRLTGSASKAAIQVIHSFGTLDRKSELGLVVSH